MRTSYTFLALFVNLAISMAQPDWNTVNAKYEEIVSGWHEKAQKDFEGVSGEDHRDNLKTAEQMLTTYLSAEILSKLTELGGKITKDLELVQAKLVEAKQKKPHLFNNHPVIRGGRPRSGSYGLA